jgi:hypothetical protein
MSNMFKCCDKDNLKVVHLDVLCGSSVSGKIFLDRKMVAQVWDELMVWIEKAQLQNHHLQHPLSMCTINVDSSLSF